ncbi:sugar transferase [Patescibacteria group bacterium]
MDTSSKKESIILFLGDIVAFVFSLWLTLLVRYISLPNSQVFIEHIKPFSFLFIIWIIVFFIAGLYEKRFFMLRRKLFSLIFNTQIINSIIAVIFFYFVPVFGISPKTNLFIYLIFSFTSIIFWRSYLVSSFGLKSKVNALIVSASKEAEDIRNAINSNPWHSFKCVSFLDLNNTESVNLQSKITETIKEKNITVIIADFENEKIQPVLSHFYNLIFNKIRFVDINKIYEDVYNKVSFSNLKYSWFLEYVSAPPRIAYDSFKRIMDLTVATLLGLVSLIFYPFVYIAIKLDDKGSIFFKQNRVGKGGKVFQIIKFRSMDKDGWKVTKVGGFLRKTRIDELPQLWNVLKGELSLIGPRPEKPELVKVYEKDILYYNIRHMTKPGLSGWAQIYHEDHPHHNADKEKTVEKLSYDLYYIKNRSLVLDLKIALKTIKTLLSRSGV